MLLALMLTIMPMHMLLLLFVLLLMLRRKVMQNAARSNTFACVKGAYATHAR
jgi:hypothetical protein